MLQQTHQSISPLASSCDAHQHAPLLPIFNWKLLETLTLQSVNTILQAGHMHLHPMGKDRFMAPILKLKIWGITHVRELGKPFPGLATSLQVKAKST